MTPQLAVNYLWLIWFASWLVAAFWSDRAAARPSFGSELLYRAVTFAGALLLFGVTSRSYSGPLRLWSLDERSNWSLLVLCACGFCILLVGADPFGSIVVGVGDEEGGHRIVDTGPYAIVRHPIYTGLIASVLATAAVKGTGAALVGAAIMTLGFWIKARLEERFLREQLGADAYDGYSRRVPMLLPFGPKAS